MRPPSQPAKQREEGACLSFAPPVVRMTQFSATHTHTHTDTERSTHSFTSTQGTQKSSALCNTHGLICMLPLFLQNQRPGLTVGPSVRIVPRSSGTLVVEGRGWGVSDVSLLVLPVSSLIVHRLHPLAN